MVDTLGARMHARMHASGGRKLTRCGCVSRTGNVETHPVAKRDVLTKAANHDDSGKCITCGRDDNDSVLLICDLCGDYCHTYVPCQRCAGGNWPAEAC